MGSTRARNAQVTKLLAIILCCLSPVKNSFAVNHVFPGAVAPLTFGNGSDTLTVNSGNMTAATGGFTVITAMTPGAAAVTVNSGATLSYSGSTGSAIYFTSSGTYTILNNGGTISSADINSIVLESVSAIPTITLQGFLVGSAFTGGSLFGGISMTSTSASASVNLFGPANITGPVTLGNNVRLNFDGQNAATNGTITGAITGGGLNVMNVAATTALNPTPIGTTNITLGSTVSGFSTINIGTSAAVIGRLTTGGAITGVTTGLLLQPNSTLVLNHAISGIGTGTINGIMTIGVPNAYALTGATSVASTGVIQVNAAWTPAVVAFTHAGSLRINDNGNFSSTAAFRAGNAGETILSGTGAFSGSFTGVSGATLIVNGTGVVSGDITTVSGMTVTFNTAYTFPPTSIFTNGGTTVIGTNGVFTPPASYSNTGTTTLAGVTVVDGPTPSTAGRLVGNYTGGSGSVFNINSSGSIEGALTLGAGSTINFNNGVLGSVPSPGSITGAITATTSNIVIGPVTAGSFTTAAEITGISNLTVTNGVFVNNFAALNVANAVSIGASGILRLNKILTGTATLNNAGNLFINVDNGLSITGAVTNGGTITVTDGATFVQPTTFTSSGVTTLTGTGSISGSYVTGNGSTLNINGSGSVNGAYTAGNNATITLTGSGGITNATTMGTNALVNISNTGTNNGKIAGTLRIGASSTINFYNGATGGGSITGGIIGSASTINVGIASGLTPIAGNFTPTAAVTGISSINVISGTFTNSFGVITLNTPGVFAISAAGTATLTKAINGSAAVTNAGTLNIQGVNALATTASFTNTGIVKIYSSFNPATSSFINTGPAGTISIYSGGTFFKPASFTNTGITDVDGTGTISGAYSGNGGSVLNVGITTATTNFTTSGAIAGIETINVKKGTFNVNNAVTTLTNFTVYPDATAILNTGLGQASTIGINNGVLTINAINAFGAGNASWTLTNNATGKLNIASTFTTTSSTFTNKGGIYIYGSAGNLVGTLASDGSSTASLNIGTDSTGFNLYSTTAYTSTADISATPTVRVYAGTFNLGHNITGLTTFTVDQGATFNKTAGIFTVSDTTIINDGAATFSSAFAFGGTTKSITNSTTGVMTFDTLDINTTNFTTLFANYGTMNVTGVNMTTDAAFVNHGIINVNGVGKILTTFTNSGNSTLNLNGAGVAGVAVVGPVTMGGNSAININSTGTITGGVNLGYGSTINFNQPSGVGIVGAITTLSGRINIGPVSAGSYTTTAAGLTGLSYLTVTNGTFTHAVAGPNPLIVDTQVSVLASGVLTLNQLLQGTGQFSNAGIVNVSGTTFSTTGFTRGASNSGTMNVSNGGLTVNSTFINTGAIRLNTGAGVATLTGNLVGGSGSSLAIGFAAANSLSTAGTVTGIETITVNRASTYTVNHAISGVATAFNINNTGGASTVILNANLSGTGLVNISAGSTLRLNTGTTVSGFSALNNDGGTIRANGTSTIGPNITNTNSTAGATLLIGPDAAANFTTNGTITDIQTITISANASSFRATHEVLGVTAASTGFTVGATSSATFSAPLTGSGPIHNNGSIISSAPINMLTYDDTSTSAFTALSTDRSTYGSLACQGVINFDGHLIVQEAEFPLDTPKQFVIVAGAPGSAMPTTNRIFLPANRLLNQWNVDTSSSQLIVVNHVRHQLDPKNKMFGDVLDAMYASYIAGTANATQTAIITALLNSSTNFNDALHKLIPNQNSIAPAMALHHSAMTKIEVRVAALRDGLGATPSAVGMNAGDLSPNTSMWIGNFGSITNQQSLGENEGYKAKSAGMLLGLDHKNWRGNVLGLAIGVSHAGVTEYSNAYFNTKLNSAHLLVYGTQNYKQENYLDWMVTGSSNINHGNRAVIFGGADLSTQSNYKSHLVAIKLIRGKSFEVFDSYRITPLTSFQYAMSHRAAYDETGGAPLHVAEQNKNIVTLGVGAKFGFPIDAWKLIGMREIKAVVTYDVLNNRNSIKANFLAGSGNFTLVDSPARLGLKLGAGMTFEMAENLQLQLHYDFEMRRKFTDHTGMVKFRYLF